MHWDRKDWLIFGGIAADVGIAFVFDEDHPQGGFRETATVLRTASLTHWNQFGQEYSAGDLLAFYIGGEFLHDPRAKSVALDGISASIIASGLIVQPLKYVIGRSRPKPKPRRLTISTHSVGEHRFIRAIQRKPLRWQ